MFDFSTPVDRHGTWCTQWDYIADRFGQDDLLPFTISDMDFATAPCILDAMQHRIGHGVFGYSRWQHKDFLSAIEHWFQQRFSSTIDRQMVVYGPSVIYILAQLLRQWTQPGDHIVTFTPAYDAFYKTVAGNDRKLIACPLTKTDNHWQMDVTLLESQLASPHCQLLLLCSPHNPTGKVWSKEELQQIATLCQRYNVKVISDEIHMDMLWGNSQHTPWHEVATSEWALITSASKSFNIPALTGAYGLISSPTSRDAYLHQLKQCDGLSSPSVLSVLAHITAYRQGGSWLDALREYLQANLHYVAQRLNQAFPQLNWQPPQSTYLAWIDLRPLAINDDVLQQELIRRQKVAIMPGTTYGDEGKGFLRLNVGCPRSKLESGIDKLIAGIQAVQTR